MNFFIDIVRNGGIFIFPLLLSSVVLIAIALDRLFNLRVSKVIQHDLLIEIEDAISSNRLNDVLKITANYDTPMMRIARVAVLNSRTGREGLKNAMEEAGRLEVPHLEKYLTPLNTIAVISPLFGLLGTVTGMIRVFDSTVGDALSNIDSLAGGISEALLSTAVGLIVALPAIVAHSYFSRKVDLISNEMERHSLTLFNILMKAVEKK